MGIYGNYGDNPLPTDPLPLIADLRSPIADLHSPIADPQHDSSSTGGQGPTGSPAFGGSAPNQGAPLLGDDRLQLSAEPMLNPFQVLINYRRRQKRRRQLPGMGD